MANMVGGRSEKKSAPPMKSGGHEPGSIAEHLSQMHAQHGGKHMHIHHDGGTITTHHVGEDGKVEGPHDHPDMDSVREHMSKVMGDGDNDNEAPGAWGGSSEAPPKAGGLFG